MNEESKKYWDKVMEDLKKGDFFEKRGVKERDLLSIAERHMFLIDKVNKLQPRNVLEVGTGNPYVIYVIVQDSNNHLRLTRGGTFSYYEFEYPMNERLTDEEWHNILDTTTTEIPEWISFTVLDNIIPLELNRNMQTIFQERK